MPSLRTAALMVDLEKHGLVYHRKKSNSMLWPAGVQIAFVIRYIELRRHYGDNAQKILLRIGQTLVEYMGSGRRVFNQKGAELGWVEPQKMRLSLVDTNNRTYTLYLPSEGIYYVV